MHQDRSILEEPYDLIASMHQDRSILEEPYEVPNKYTTKVWLMFGLKCLTKGAS